MTARKPTKLHIAAGNPSKKSKEELDFSKEANPDPDTGRPPHFLKGEARREWTRVARVLRKNGLLTEADRSMLTLYCEAHQTYREAMVVYEEALDLYEGALGRDHIRATTTMANLGMLCVIKTSNLC